MEPAGARLPGRDTQARFRRRHHHSRKDRSLAKRMYYQDEDFDVAEAVEKVAKNRGVTPAQVASAWILQKPGITAPIVGATKTRHLTELIDAVGIKLTPEEVAEVERPLPAPSYPRWRQRQGLK